jgi:hypothetical protein
MWKFNPKFICLKLNRKKKVIKVKIYFSKWCTIIINIKREEQEYNKLNSRQI